MLPYLVPKWAVAWFFPFYFTLASATPFILLRLCHRRSLPPKPVYAVASAGLVAGIIKTMQHVLRSHNCEGRLGLLPLPSPLPRNMGFILFLFVNWKKQKETRQLPTSAPNTVASHLATSFRYLQKGSWLDLRPSMLMQKHVGNLGGGRSFKRLVVLERLVVHSKMVGRVKRTVG